VSYVAGQTAVIVPIADAEAAVGRARARHDRSAQFGVPAHVTVIFPFLPQARLDAPAVAELRAIVAAQPAFDVVLRGFGRFPTTLYLAPEPAEPFVRLTDALVRRWPEAPPYGGAFGADVIPHLTVTDRASAADEAQAAREVAAHLPVTATVDAAWLIRYDGATWSWWVELPFAR
jgi:2'-5' RNA ligase